LSYDRLLHADNQLDEPISRVQCFQVHRGAETEIIGSPKQGFDTRAPVDIGPVEHCATERRNLTMTRDDLLLRILDCLVAALFGAALWALLTL